MEKQATYRFEWQTTLLLAATYASWFLLVLYGQLLHPVIWVFLTGLITTLFLSLTHELVHGHPTNSWLINRLMGLLPISWIFPYERFRDTHLEHHETGELTDPYDDPESWYLVERDWMHRTRMMQRLLEFNNTLFGRMMIGPVLNLIRFLSGEVEQFLKQPGTRIYLALVWGLHLVLCLGLVAFISTFSTVPAWQFVAAAYLGNSLLLIRTFLEHQAAENQEERTVIIEQNCPISFLFLFNNLHVVHHSHPGVPWYRLPSFYRENRETFLEQNKAYVYRSYSEVFRRYFFHMKERVPHPLRHREG